jgi:hypothetical protein
MLIVRGRSGCCYIRSTAMEKEMQGKTARILIVVRDGSSGGHLDYGRFRMMEEGYDLTVAAPAQKPLQTVVHYPQAIVEYPKEGTVFSYKETALRRHCVRWPKCLGRNQFIDFDAKAFHSLWVGKAGGELLQRNSLAQALRSLA